MHIVNKFYVYIYIKTLRCRFNWFTIINNMFKLYIDPKKIKIIIFIIIFLNFMVNWYIFYFQNFKFKSFELQNIKKRGWVCYIFSATFKTYMLLIQVTLSPPVEHILSKYILVDIYDNSRCNIVQAYLTLGIFNKNISKQILVQLEA